MKWVAVWNWKAAILGALCRGAIFFVVNTPAGFDAAWIAMQVEFAYRGIASGFYGSLAQRFARMRNAGLGMWMAIVVLPGIAHLVEFVVHSWAATPFLGTSLAGSVAFSVLTTRFTVIAMRRGVMIVGAGTTWRQDLKALPAAVVAFFRVS